VLGSLLGGVAALLIAMSQSGPQAASSPHGDFTLGEGIRYQNLTVFPVVSHVAKNDDSYITLDEGLKAGTVVVAELGAAANVGQPSIDIEALSETPAPSVIPHCGSPAANVEVVAEDDPFGPAPKSPAAPNAVAGADPFGAPDTDVPAPPAANNPFGPLATPSAQARPAVPDIEEWESISDPFGGRAAVNTVTVLNRSDRPLYLMPGEIIVGGQQDRTLARETIIPPGDKPVTVEVYCVEHGRWHGRAGHESAAYFEALSDGPVLAAELSSLSAKAGAGQFVQSAGSLSKTSRLAVQGGFGQSAVWDQVSANNRRSGVTVATDAFTANYADTDVKDKLQPYLDALQAKVAGQAHVVGVVVAINGKPEMADVFGSTPLFRKLWPKLLKSYALDASQVAEAAHKTECTLAQAQDFFDAAAKAQAVDRPSRGQGLVVTQKSSEHVDSFSAFEAVGEANLGRYGEFSIERAVIPRQTFGASVHSSAFAK